MDDIESYYVELEDRVDGAKAKAQTDKQKGEQLRNAAIERMKDKMLRPSTPSTAATSSCISDDSFEELSAEDLQSPKQPKTKRKSLQQLIEERTKQREARAEAELELKRRKLDIEERKIAAQEKQLDLLIELVRKK